jgi:hypothetical protein
MNPEEFSFLTDAIKQFEGWGTGGRSDRHANPGAMIYTKYLGEEFGATPGEPFTDHEGKTYHTAMFPDAESGEMALNRIVSDRWNKSGGDSLEFASGWSGLPIDNEVVQNYAKQIDINKKKFDEVTNLRNAVKRVKNHQEVEPEVPGLIEQFPEYVSQIKKMAKDGYHSLNEIVEDLNERFAKTQDTESVEPEIDVDTLDPSWWDKTKEAYDPELIEKSWKTGVAQAKDLAGGGLQFLDAEGILDYGEYGTQMREDAKNIMEQNFVPELGKQFEWSDFANPDFYQSKFVQAVPITGSFLASSLAVMGGTQLAGMSTIGGAVSTALLMRPFESATEAIGTYNELRDSGYTHEESGVGASDVFKKNMVLSVLDAGELTLAFAKVPKPFRGVIAKTVANVGRVGVGAGVEGYEEVIQGYFNELGKSAVTGEAEPELIEALSLATPKQREEFALGTLFGTVFQVGGSLASRKPTPEEVNAIIEEQQEIYYTRQEAREKANEDYTTETQQKASIFGTLFDDINVKFVDGFVVDNVNKKDLEKSGYTDFSELTELTPEDDGYIEGETIFKDVAIPGQSKMNADGSVDIIIDSTKDESIIIEEMVESIYKVLGSKDPQLKERIDTWIRRHEEQFPNSRFKGVELLSKSFVANNMGFGSQMSESDILPDGIALGIFDLFTTGDTNLLNQVREFKTEGKSQVGELGVMVGQEEKVEAEQTETLESFVSKERKKALDKGKKWTKEDAKKSREKYRKKVGKKQPKKTKVKKEKPVVQQEQERKLLPVTEQQTPDTEQLTLEDQPKAKPQQQKPKTQTEPVKKQESEDLITADNIKEQVLPMGMVIEGIANVTKKNPNGRAKIDSMREMNGKIAYSFTDINTGKQVMEGGKVRYVLRENFTTTQQRQKEGRQRYLDDLATINNKAERKKVVSDSAMYNKMIKDGEIQSLLYDEEELMQMGRQDVIMEQINSDLAREFGEDPTLPTGRAKMRIKLDKYLADLQTGADKNLSFKNSVESDSFFAMLNDSYQIGKTMRKNENNAYDNEVSYDNVGEFYNDHRSIIDRFKSWWNNREYRPQQFRDVVATFSSQIRRIHKDLPRQFKEFEFNTVQFIRRFEEKVKPFASKLDGLYKKANKDAQVRQDYMTIVMALNNGDFYKAIPLFKKYDMITEFHQSRKALEQLYKVAKSVGYDLGYLENYFPRMVMDHAGLLEYLQGKYGGTSRWVQISEAIKEAEISRKAKLTFEEKAHIANAVLYGQYQTPQSIGNFKKRKIEKLDPEMLKFYAPPQQALVQYAGYVSEIAMAKQFLMGSSKRYTVHKKKNRYYVKDNKIGKYTNEEGYSRDFAYKELDKLRMIEQGLAGMPILALDDMIPGFVLTAKTKYNLDGRQEERLQTLLQAYFNRDAMNPFLKGYKSLSYIDTMGSFFSAITQLGDLGISTARAGGFRTMKNFLKGLTQAKRLDSNWVTLEEIGIEGIGEEFRNEGALQRALDIVFTISGIKALDRLGKETTVNSVMDKYRKIARSGKEGSREYREFMVRLEETFGESMEVQDVLNDLKNGVKSENIRLLAYSELLNVQPVAKSQMPVKYLNSANGRIFYMLKTYQLKRFDVFKDEMRVLDQVADSYEATGNTAKAKLVRYSKAQKLATLGIILMLAEASADEIKDLMASRDSDLSDKVISNLLRLIGISRYHFYSFRKDGLSQAVLKLVMPPVDIIDDPLRDIDKIGKSYYKNRNLVDTWSAVEADIAKSGLRTPKHIPFVGKFLHWYPNYFGKVPKDLPFSAFGYARRRQDKKEGITGSGFKRRKTRSTRRRNNRNTR